MKVRLRRALVISLLLAIMPSLVIASTAHASDIYINVQSDDPYTGYLSTFNLCADGGNLDSYTHWFTSRWITNNHPGEVFIGWQIDGTGTLFPDQSPCSNFPDRSHIFAQWTPAPYAVTFESNGGTGSMSIQTSSVTANLSANTFIRDGYDFAGWNTHSDGIGGASYDDEDSYNFASDLTLYAQWIRIATVTFEGNGGTAGNMWSQTSSSRQRLRANTFTRSGFQFAGWSTDVNGCGTKFSNLSFYDFSADITLYAQWRSNSGYTVTFDSNGGSGCMSNQSSSVSANLSPNIFTHGDFVFTGWSTTADGTGDPYVDAASYSFSSDVTLYAQWESGSTVTFDPNGGSGSMASQTAHGSVGLTSNTYSRDGYDFLGWSTTADGTGDPYADGGTYNFQSFSLANAHLYAQWRVRSSGTKGDAQAAALAAQQAAQAHFRAVEEAKSEIKSLLSSGESLTVGQLVKAEITGVTDTNIALINADLAKLPDDKKADLSQLNKIIQKFVIVDKVAKGSRFYPNDLVTIGLIPQDSKIKTWIAIAIRKLSPSDRDTFEKIQAAVAEAEKVILARQARLTALLAKNQK